MKKRILVLDGNQRAALAAVRSLGARELWVAVAESSPQSMAGVSRFCKTTFTYPDPYSSPRLFFNAIVQKIEQLGISFLLPITEATFYILLQYRDELPDNVIFPFPETEAVEKVANKNNLLLLASHEGIPTPATIFCQNADEGKKALTSIKRFPVVLKPFKSKILAADSIISTQVLVARSKDEANYLLNKHQFFTYPFTIQSFIEGSGQGVFALFNRGKPICYFSHRRLREKPPSGGVSVLSEATHLNNSLKRSAENLLRQAKWHGVAMVEFRISVDGTGYLMEVNPRFWGSLQLAIDSGVDFPWLLYQISIGEPVRDIHWTPRRVRWLLGDLDRLYLILKSPMSTYSLAQKLMEFGRFLKPGLRTRHEVNRVNDLRPFWFELQQYFNTAKK